VALSGHTAPIPQAFGAIGRFPTSSTDACPRPRTGTLRLHVSGQSRTSAGRCGYRGAARSFSSLELLCERIDNRRASSRTWQQCYAMHDLNCIADGIAEQFELAHVQV
jgi:hypothetical protein